MKKTRLGCCVSGCGDIAPWIPVLVMVPLGSPEGSPADTAELELPVCDLHRKKVKLKDLLDDAAWAAMAEFFESRGRVMPDRSRIELDFKHMEMGFPC